ncbi:MAG: mercury(II) reductase [Gammaproteobacteria bacterium]|nr:MAG: mercury(II) reductase [Gammaproteobacteria bacterium]
MNKTVSHKEHQVDSRLHIVVIGSGSAAFAGALAATERGARVTMVEGGDVIGGCCVNVGCVPSKILIRAAHLAYQQAHHAFAAIEHHEPKIDRAKLTAQISERVKSLRFAKYERILSRNPSIDFIRGWAKLLDARTVEVLTPQNQSVRIVADKILIATGATPWIPPIPGLEKTPYWRSTEEIFADEMPHHLVVIGSSVIAVELAQAYRRLGAEVTILARHRLLSKYDAILGDNLVKYFAEEGIRVITQATVKNVVYQAGEFVVSLGNEKVCGDRLLVATGRRPNTADLNLAAAGVATDDSGAIIVNERLETSCPGIYAAGDCANLPQLVYVAAAAGHRAGMNMMGERGVLNLDAVPMVIFTDPQVATVGLSPQEAIAQGLRVETRTLSLDNVPRALANFDERGFIRLVAEADNQCLLGAQILAHDAGEMIQTVAVAIEQRMSVTEFAEMLFPYLTMNEGLKLCAQAFFKDVSQLSCCAG